MEFYAFAIIFSVFFISGITRNGCSTEKEDHAILKRQINLLQGGVGTNMKLRRSTIQPQCLPNEYGSNCIYCMPSDTCEQGHFTCDVSTGNKICLPGYHGENCKRSAEILNEYHVTCPENTCRNGGTCSSGRCCCRKGFTGILCEIEIIECKNQSCLNGGVCKDLIGKFECLCKPPFHGQKCDMSMNPHIGTTPSRDSGCQSKSCKNNGTCLEDTFLTYCLCPTYYTGENCETRTGKPPESGTLCPQNYYGDGCKTYCKSQDNCFGHFVCDEATGEKICLGGWHGHYCDTRVVPQSVDPLCPKHGCKNDGQCSNKGCCCKNNYTGDYCQVESIGCLSSPCKNNAKCVNQGNGYACLCQLNFTGKVCETQISTNTYTVTMTYSNSNYRDVITFSASSATEHTIQPSHTYFAVSSNTLAESLHFRPVTFTHNANIYTDISKSEPYNFLAKSESQLSISESSYSLMPIYTSAASSSTFSDSFVTQSSSFSPIFFSTVSRTLQVTSSSNVASLLIHSEYLSGTANTLSSTGSLSSFFSTAHISSNIYHSIIDFTTLNSLSSISSLVLIHPTITSKPITSSTDKSLIKTTISAASPSLHEQVKTIKFSSKMYTVSTDFSSALSMSSSHSPSTKHVSSEQRSTYKADNSLITTISSLQQSSVFTNSNIQNLRPTVAQGSAMLPSTNIMTTIKKLVNFSSDKSSTASLDSGSPLLASSVMSSIDIRYDRTSFYDFQHSFTNDVASNLIKASRVVSGGLFTSSRLSTDSADPSSLHMSTTPSLNMSHSIPPYLSNTANIQSSQLINSINLLSAERYIASSTNSLDKIPAKTPHGISSSDDFENTFSYGEKTVTKTSGVTGRTVLIHPTKSSFNSRLTKSGDNNNHNELTSLHERSRNILTPEQTGILEFVTQSTSVGHSSGTMVISDLNIDTGDDEGLSKTWRIALIVVACVLFLVAIVFLVVFLSVRQRRKDSRTISQSPSDIQEFSKEHFSEQPDFNNPTYDTGNDSDDDSIKYDIYVVNE